MKTFWKKIVKKNVKKKLWKTSKKHQKNFVKNEKNKKGEKLIVRRGEFWFGGA